MPAINIALALKTMNTLVEPLFVGRKNGMEAAIVGKFGFQIREIEASGLKRSPLGLVKFVVKWRKSIAQARQILNEFDPAMVVGTGGYVSGPMVRAAYKAGKPIFLQEQNSLPGLATRTLNRMAEKVFISYDSAARYLDKSKCHSVGNPIRPDLLKADRAKSFRDFGLEPSLKTLLIIGGSSGARGINHAMIEIIAAGIIPLDWQLLWQTGQKDFDEITNAEAMRLFRGKHLAFIFEMPAAYSIADLVICRSGAMTLAELAAWGLPSILIPYPHATGDHQTINAREFVDAGAAQMIAESKLRESLSDALINLMAGSEKRDMMAGAAKKLARPEAANIIARAILERIG